MQSGGGADDAWLADLREESRLLLIRRIVMERLANGGFSGAPRPVDLDSTSDAPPGGLDDVSPASKKEWSFTPLLRDIAIGVGVSVLAAWVCTRWGIGQSRRK